MALKPARLQWSGNGAVSSADFGDIYFQPGDSFGESDYVFLQRNCLPERFATAQTFRIAELGFGTSLNFLLTAALWKKTAPPGARLYYASIEKHPLEKSDLARVHAFWPELSEFSAPLLEQYPPMVSGFHHVLLPGIHLCLLLGDVAEMLPALSGAFDAWYLDGFAPAKNPEMWTEEIFPLIRARTAPGGTLSTFSAASRVRRGLEAAGFEARKEQGFGRKREMTTAALPGARAEKAREKITIVGAGMAGCSAARALAEKGYRVSVVDRRDSFAQEASGNHAGILYPKLTAAPSPAGAFHGHGFCYTRALLSVLRVPSWTPCGVLLLDLDAEEARRSETLVERNGYPPDFARTVEDAGGVAGIPIAKSALYHPGAGYLSPPEFCAALLDHPNIETRFAQDVKQPEGITVLAAANGLSAFGQAAWLPLEPLRGQITHAAPTPESLKLKTVLCHEGFVTPAVNGVHVAGATFQKEPVDAPSLRDEDHAENLSKLHARIPALKDVRDVMGGRAAWRATTPDKLPLIGPCPDRAAFLRGEEGYVGDLYISAGFGAHGLSGAPLAGEIVASMIAGDPLPVPADLLSFLRPERFLLRDIRRGKVK